MIVAFKDQFVPFVLDGSKQHTLRDERQGDRQIVVGDRLDLYARVRQADQYLLGRYLCTRVRVARFELHEESPAVVQSVLQVRVRHVMYIDGVELDQSEADLFAWRDGFRMRGIPRFNATHADNCYSLDPTGCFASMMRYWITEGKNFPFEKRLIHWDHSKPITAAMMAYLHPKRRKIQ